MKRKIQNKKYKVKQVKSAKLTKTTKQKLIKTCIVRGTKAGKRYGALVFFLSERGNNNII